MWLKKGTPQDTLDHEKKTTFSVSDEHSTSIGRPLCTILQHRKTLVQVANLSARAVMVHNGVTEMFPFSRAVRFCFHTAEHRFPIHLKQHKGDSEQNAAFLCRSPKINNVPSYTTCLSFCLSFESEWKAWLTRRHDCGGSFNHRILHITDYALMIVSRVSGVSTGIEWVQEDALYTINKTENPLTHVTHSIMEDTKRLAWWQ